MHLVVDEYGLSIGKTSERLVMKQKGQVVAEYPFFDLEQVTIASRGVALSTDVIMECVERGINIHIVSFDGRPFASIQSPQLGGTVLTRRAQLAAFNDQRGLELAKAFVIGKMKNQINVLKYFGKYRKETDKDSFDELRDKINFIEQMCIRCEEITGEHINSTRNSFLTTEAHASKAYWQGVTLLLQNRIQFSGREHRGATDPFNSLLNYGYAILLSQVWSALTLAGLDPFGGFMHVDRPGKPSLVLDFMEEFRPPVVDRVAIAFVTKGRPLELDNEGRLAEKTRKEYAASVLDRLQAQGRFEKEKVRLQTVIYRQARHIATHVRGVRKYKPFVDAW